jgi:peroxiredoxin
MVSTETPAAALGWAAPDFTLPGVDGAEHRYEDCRGDRGTVVMFICNHCPYVKASLDRTVRDARDLLSLGVRCVAISSNDPAHNPDDSFEQMKRVARARDFPFPYLYDESQAVARAYGAVCTPDFFGFNAAGLLQYRGRLDAGRRDAPPPGAPRELYEAMKLIAATGRGPADQHPSIGCSIKWRGGTD